MNAYEASGGHTIYLAEISGQGAGDRIELDQAEAKHLKALRLAEGQAVTVTNGKGAVWSARLVGRGRGSAVELSERGVAPGRLPVDLWAPVGNKQAMLWLVEKATELGAARIQPVEFERSGSVADAGRSPAFWEKARRRTISALKQSGGAWLPELLPSAALPQLLGSPAADPCIRVVLDRGGRPLSRVIESPVETAVVVLVGPEGGLSASELSACLEAGFESATLGPSILRFETAAVAGLAIVAQKRAMQHSPRGERSPE